MTFSVRSETAARIIQGMTPEQLKAPGAVDQLVELAESDAKLTAEEKTALKGALLQFQQSGFDPVQRTRLEAYLGMTNATLRHTLAAGAQDGVLDIKDAQKALKAIQADGKVSNTERMTVRSAMIAFKMDAAATAALNDAMAPATGPFKDVVFKDAALANTLRGFTGVDKLGVAQVDALLKAAADGTGISNTERQDLTGLYKNHGALLDTTARVKLAAALGISGLEGAPLGTSRIECLDAAQLVSTPKGLDFRKEADGTMFVKMTQEGFGTHGWMPVNADGTFSSLKRTGGEYPSQDRSEFEAKGKVSFENGKFVAEFSDRYTTFTTRPQGSGDTPNWNSGNRIPYSYGGETTHKTQNHPSLEGTRIYQGTISRGGGYSSVTTPVSLQKTADGTFLQVAGGAPYNGRIPVGADGKIAYGMWSGQVGANGSVSLQATQRLSANYTESVSWTGRIDGYNG